MHALPPRPHHRRAVVSVLGAVVALTWGGCATQRASLSVAEVRAMAATRSPEAEAVGPRAAWRLAEDYAQAHPGCEVLVGNGDSMLPLYHDRTVLVVERVALARLLAGMTVIFMGERGWPVAHTLVEKTPQGWRTMGLGNHQPDRTLMRRENYIGTVVKAYAPTVVAANSRVARAEPITFTPSLAALARVDEE